LNPIKIHLAEIDPGDTHGISRQDAAVLSCDLEGQLTQLQETLYAAGDRSILIVLQGLDTAGKDGTINHVMAAFNPAGCRVESFKVPNSVELAHDFLWRVHRVTPPQGSIAIFKPPTTRMSSSPACTSSSLTGYGSVVTGTSTASRHS
jgi:polyphosphate kinase 2 (PPK2 family)